jgi:hypothetical protein
MRIVSSNVALTSSRIDTRISTIQEHLRTWDVATDRTRSSESTNGAITAARLSKKDFLRLSRPATRQLAEKVSSPPARKHNDPAQTLDEEFVGDVKIRLIKDIIEMFTGRKIEVFKPGELKSDSTGEAPSADNPSTENQAAAPEGWGIDYRYRETRYSKEGVAFTAAGTVGTVDGKTIVFNASLEMSRETYEEVNISLKAGDALKDPLLIDLAGNGAGFTGAKFTFDIDADGHDELLYTPGPGAGILAYDRNGNGIVDNGTELFGPRTGNGFSELALLDEDNNGWIDEGDSAFNHLRVWEKNGEGTDSVSSLLERGIGALYTGSAKTDYALTTTGNALAGILRESSVYLKENGGTGILQEVDLVV